MQTFDYQTDDYRYKQVIYSIRVCINKSLIIMYRYKNYRSTGQTPSMSHWFIQTQISYELVTPLVSATFPTRVVFVVLLHHAVGDLFRTGAIDFEHLGRMMSFTPLKISTKYLHQIVQNNCCF